MPHEGKVMDWIDTHRGKHIAVEDIFLSKVFALTMLDLLGEE
jgi:hypothetical protein